MTNTPHMQDAGCRCPFCAESRARSITAIDRKDALGEALDRLVYQHARAIAEVTENAAYMFAGRVPIDPSALTSGDHRTIEFRLTLRRVRT